VYSFEELKSLGASSPAEPVPPKTEDLSTIMYTSGTTGDPKGVMLTHKAVLAGVANIVFYCKINNINFNETDSMISYLPLAHIFDR
jgi:long-chain acyl-CoA synthetase